MNTGPLIELTLEQRLKLDTCGRVEVIDTETAVTE
jgi:hypothetical protein